MKKSDILQIDTFNSDLEGSNSYSEDFLAVLRHQCIIVISLPLNLSAPDCTIKTRHTIVIPQAQRIAFLKFLPSMDARNFNFKHLLSSLDMDN